MKYVGIDLHKQTISICVVNQAREVLDRKRFYCSRPERIRAYFQMLGAFEMVVEATASYEWLFELLESLAEKAVLAHPKKLRVIAESTRKSDRLDAQVLAEFLACDMIPTSYRPTPRQRAHRRLVRQRGYVQRRITAIKNRIRRLLSDYNSDIPNLFTDRGLKHIDTVLLSGADRFAMDQLLTLWTFLTGQLCAAEGKLVEFAEAAPIAEREARELLRSIPGVGFVTSEVVLSELADVNRFRSQRQVVAYAGLAPGQRESAGKSRELHIEKNGSKLLRWVLVEAAWQLVRYTQRWKQIYQNLKKRLKAKKAIIAVARRLLCLMTAILKTGQPYNLAYLN